MSVFFFIFGSAYLQQSLALPMSAMGNPNAPKYFPVGLGILMILFSILMFIQEKEKPFNLAEVKKEKEQYIFIGKVALISFLYIILFKPVGYVISTTLFLFLLKFVYNGLNKWVRSTVISVVFSVSVYFIFTELLGVILPASPLGFF
jgi:putative tricarboxylic transport membrane protein